MGNGRHSSISDYSHWNEEAPYIKAQEDRYADYYADEPDYDSEPYEREEDDYNEGDDE
jgi:hypothetical protein